MIHQMNQVMTAHERHHGSGIHQMKWELTQMKVKKLLRPWGVAMAKFKNGKRWGCNRKQRNLKRRWKICMAVVGGKFTENMSSSEIGQISKMVEIFEKELELEFEDEMEQADAWMGWRS